MNGDSHQAMKTKFNSRQTMPDQKRKKTADKNKACPGNVLLNSEYLFLHCIT